MEPCQSDVAANLTPSKILPRYVDLMRSCQDTLVEQFGKLLQEILEGMDSFMLQLAENAKTNQLRSHYLEVMHETLLCQTSIQQVFAEELKRGFGNFGEGRREPLRAPVSRSHRKLGLVEKGDFEISLAHAEAVRRANERYAEHLFALNHRLAVLAGGSKLENYHPALPGSPAQVCDAMETAWATLGIQVDHSLRLAWTQEFEQKVLQRAEDIYAQFNRALIAAGILPNLSMEAIGYEPPSASGRTSVSSLRSAAESRHDATPHRNEESGAPPEHALLQLFQSVQQLLENQRSGNAAAFAQSDAILNGLNTLMKSLNAPPSHEPPSVPGTTGAAVPIANARTPDTASASVPKAADENRRDAAVDSDEEHETLPESPEHTLFQSIRQMLAARHSDQAATGSAHGGAIATDLTALLGSLNSLPLNTVAISQIPFGQLSLDAIKAHFAEQTAQLAKLARQQNVATADMDLIDLVGLLFEFVLNDNSLPDSVKALLSHLHTPILKAAIVDRKLFFRGTHPAQRLLNALTHAGALCNGNGSDSQGIFAKIRLAVEDIVQNYEEDAELFVRVLKNFNGFMDNLKRRSQAVEKRSVESAKGRERLREARQVVSKDIVDRLWAYALPKSVVELVMGPWANLLVLTYLRNGRDSQEWTDALQVVEGIIWSVQPKTSKAEQQKLRAMLPVLEEKILAGLTLIGDPENNGKALFSAFHSECLSLLQKRVSGSPEDDLPLKLEVRPAPPDIQSSRAVWNDIDPPIAPWEFFAQNASAGLSETVETLKSTPLGTWFEFTDLEKSAKQRAKLSWFSEKTSYYIFVDAAGIQVAVKSMRTLCNEIAKGETRIVPMTDKPFMDRALETIHVLLKQPGRQTFH
jgi:hypothetical protein